MLNDRMVPEELEGQLEEMAASGAKSVCMHPLPREFRWNTMMSPRYLSKEYHAIVRRLVEKAARLGMNFYLYDEGGWPSGGACGQVIAADPERFARSYAESDGAGGFRIVKVESHPERCASYPDLLVPGVTEKFLELTHRAYAARWGEDFFGKTVRYVFTDEPAIFPSLPGKLGWTADLPTEFLRRKGYRLEPFVPKLLNSCTLLNGSAVARAAIDYRDVMGQLFIERYLRPLREWCRHHKLILCGHFGGEDDWERYRLHGFGDLLQSLRMLDMPGVDVIWRQLYPGKRLHPFPKLASSAANQNGKAQAVAELFGVYGSGISPATMKYLLDFMAVCGVNTYIFHNISQSLRDGNMSGMRPHFGPVDPLWKCSEAWHSYAARISWLTSRGKAVRDTALYFDHNAMALGGIETEYAVSRGVKAADLLLESQNDFDYVDDAMLASARIRNGFLNIGKAKYRRLVIPSGSLLGAVAERLVGCFRSAGGEVIDAEHPDAASSPLLRVEPASRALRVAKRDLGDGEKLYFIFNSSEFPVSADLTIPETGPVALADAESGRIFAVPSECGSWHWNFAPRESRCFIAGRAGASPLPASPGECLSELRRNWRLKPLWRRVAGEHEFRTVVCDDPTRKVKLGDWRTELNGEFSGDVEYSCSFRYDEPEATAFLDLGDVRHAARVILNDRELGTRLWSPYVFPLDGALKRGVNRLKIVVTNTLANALSDEALAEHWRRDFPPESPYEQQQRCFEREELSSGLFGPVRLLTASAKASLGNEHEKPTERAKR